MKKFFYIAFFLITSLGFAQEALNNYKYIVVPVKFNFQKQENQFQLNTLLKSKFEQLGFQSYLETDDLPEEVKTNSCSYLKPVINAKSNMFSTKTIIDLVDCDKKSVFSTIEGVSKSKNIRASYIEALRMSLKSFDGFQYKYEPNEITFFEVKGGDENINHSEHSKELQINYEDSKSSEVIKSSHYVYRGDKYYFSSDLSGFHKKENTNLLMEIRKLKDNSKVGVICKSSKKDIFNVYIDDLFKGFGYYNSKGDFFIEAIAPSGLVFSLEFKKIN